MARAMQPAAGTAALLRPRGLPSPRRCAAAAKRQTHQVGCISNPPQKLPLSSATTESGWLRSPALSCACSGSSSGAATWSSSRSTPANGWRDRVDDDDAVSGDRVVVISGYWTGPGIDDGCGHVQAIVQRISAWQ